MDIDVQQYESQFAGFVDDSDYSNILGIGKKAKKIDAQTSGIRAQTEAVKAAADAESQKIAQQLSASEKATKDALEKAEFIKRQLEEAKISPISTGDMQPAKKGLSKPVLIGGGVLLVGIVLVLILKK